MPPISDVAGTPGPAVRTLGFYVGTDANFGMRLPARVFRVACCPGVDVYGGVMGVALRLGELRGRAECGCRGSAVRCGGSGGLAWLSPTAGGVS